MKDTIELIKALGDYFEKAIKYIPILTFFFIFFSSAELYFYFRYFKINIFNYITVEEIIFTFYKFFFEHLTGFLSFSFIFLVAYFYFIKEPKKILQKRWIALIIPVIAIILIILKDIFDFKISSILIEILLTIPYLMFYFNMIKSIEDLKIKLLLLFVFIFGYMSVKIGYLNEIKAREIIDSKSNITVKFNYLEKQIKSKTDFTYIGETSNFIFLYSKNGKETFVYNKNEINNLTYKNN
jgi:hypothetical protein